MEHATYHPVIKFGLYYHTPYKHVHFRNWPIRNRAHLRVFVKKNTKKWGEVLVAANFHLQWEVRGAAIRYQVLVHLKYWWLTCIMLVEANFHCLWAGACALDIELGEPPKNGKIFTLCVKLGGVWDQQNLVCEPSRKVVLEVN